MSNTVVTTADYGTIITAIGAAKITESILNGTKVNVTHAAVGDGSGAYYKPSSEQTNLKNECWRGEITSYKINEANNNMLDVTFVVPADIGGFTIREAALIDADGDVVAICNTPDAQKVALIDGVSFPIKMVMHIIVTDASAVEISINPSLGTVTREELYDELDKQAKSVGSAITHRITVPTANWTLLESPVGRYRYTASVKIDDCLDEHFPVMALDVPSLDVASAAELCPTIETLDGAVRFWARKIPSVALSGTIFLRSENLLYPDVPAGDYDIATGAGVEEAMQNAFDEQA